MSTGPPEDKMLATGLHKVRDIYCKPCLTIVGWTYVSKDSLLLEFCENLLHSTILPKMEWKSWRISDRECFQFSPNTFADFLTLLLGPCLWRIGEVQGRKVRDWEGLH